MKPLRLIDENARILREMHEEIHRTFELRERSSADRSAWSEACARFHREYDRLAFPGGLSEGLRRLSEADPIAVESAVRFLEADPWFFRSGYIKADLIRHLKRCSLEESQLERLRSVVLARIAGPGRREFRAYAQLARRMATREFERAVGEAEVSGDPGTAQRARWVLRVLREATGSAAARHP